MEGIVSHDGVVQAIHDSDTSVLCMIPGQIRLDTGKTSSCRQGWSISDTPAWWFPSYSRQERSREAVVDSEPQKTIARH